MGISGGGVTAATAVEGGSSNVTSNATTSPENHFNSTSEMPQIPSYIRTTSMFLCISIMILGVIGNVMVPIVILKTKDMRNSTNIFLTNLSIADLLVLLVCTPTVLVEVNTRPETWVLGQEMCKAVPFVELTVAHASVLTILAISFERYYAICEPLKAGYVCTKTRALLICVFAWGVAALFTSPILLIASYQMETYIDGSEVAVCLTSADTFWTAFYFIGSITLFFLLPFVILLILYTIIAWNLMGNPGVIIQHHNQPQPPPLRTAAEEARKPHPHQHQNHHHPPNPRLHPHSHRTNVLKYRKQVIFMLVAVVLSFFLCLLPFRAFTLWIILMPPESIVALGIEGYYNLLYFCRIMLYLNSALNPILYNLMSSKFRNGFRRLLGCRNRRSVAVKSMDGMRKGTFHTNSTNLSTSSSTSMRREALRVSSSIRSRSESLNGSFEGEVEVMRDNSSSSGNGIQMNICEDSAGGCGGSVVVVKKKTARRQKSFDDIDEMEEIEEAITSNQSACDAC
ncbi:growth hormone secretagogue receptor type 1 [Episyrphus balteatus]|uniref:growth hormone secretagogue receptor type 1 n=1 Tax=Episyrphus balteatus TaxID=286459 RepID=UPI002485F8A1|nr:growth hormone secretagogue receptor type 1 [Episyrphus balteatus]